MKNDVQEQLWVKADAAWTKGIQAYIEFGQACAELNAIGVTQEAIAERYDISREAVAKAIRVGSDKRIVRDANNLPKDVESLYQLTTLTDEGFNELAKPNTRRADILDYKKRLKVSLKAPIVAPQRTPEQEATRAALAEAAAKSSDYKDKNAQLRALAKLVLEQLGDAE